MGEVRMNSTSITWHGTGGRGSTHGQKNYHIIINPHRMVCDTGLGKLTLENVVALKKAVFVQQLTAWGETDHLTSESVECTSLTFQSVDNVHGGDSLPLGMLGVGDCITDDVLQEHLEDTTGLFVDESRDTLYSTSASQTANSRLGDTLDVITQHLSVPFCASLSQTFSSLTTS